MSTKAILTLSLHDRNGNEITGAGYHRVAIEHLSRPIIFPIAIGSWGEVMFGYLWSSKHPEKPMFQMYVHPSKTPLLVMACSVIACRLKLPKGMAKSLRAGREYKNRGGNVHNPSKKHGAGNRLERTPTSKTVGDQDGGMRVNA